jgi:hypothetical protein
MQTKSLTNSVCPGQWFAFESVWIVVASILSSYNIQKCIDKDGQPIEPDTGFTSGQVSLPLPFKCDFVPRSKGVTELIEKTEEST